jgi:GrpB-like predicted nucleotidyltransferase (UPF0157 family)
MSTPTEQTVGPLQLARVIRRLKQQVEPGELGNETVDEFVRRYSRLRLPALDLNKQNQYDPAWPQVFEEERHRLQTAFDAEDVVAIEHIGSTSIPPLSSKNILDIAVAMRGPLTSQRQAKALARLGYQAYGESPIDPSFSWFWRLGHDDAPSFVVHICTAENYRFAEIKNFRDFLRAFPQEQQRYVDLKHALAAVSGQSWLEYSAFKQALTLSITARANAWAMNRDQSRQMASSPADDAQTQAP